MLKHFVTIAWRNIKRRKTLSFIQIMCLSVGLSAFILVARYVQYEKDWDKCHANFDRIYRAQTYKTGDRMAESMAVPVPVSSYLKENYSQVENAITIRGIWGEYLSPKTNQVFYEREGMIAPTDVFEMFSLKLLDGDKATVLDNPNAIVLSKSLADKYFPGENAMGKIILDEQKNEHLVTGIMEDIPEQSTLNASYFKSSKNLLRDLGENWKNSSFWSYVLLKPGVSSSVFSNEIHDIIQQFDKISKQELYLKPLADLHLKEHARDDRGIVIFIFSFIGILILLLACVSFMNLAASFSTLRSVEIGIRKVSGSNKKFLRWQFLTESVILAYVSLLLALGIAWLMLPFFNSIIDRNIELQLLNDPWFLVFISGIVLLTGMLSGSYPAFIISRFNPVVVLKGKSPFVKGKITGLRAMVYFQFILSIILITSSLWMYKHVNFLKNKDLGFDKENLMYCSIPKLETQVSFSQFKHQIMANPAIEDVSLSINSPLHSNWGTRIQYQNGPTDDHIFAQWNLVSDSYLNTMGIELLQGRNFSENYQADNNKCLINETAAKTFGWKNPIGKWIDDGEKYEVIGVVKDFIYQDVHNPIVPYFFRLRDDYFSKYNNLTFKINPMAITGALEHIQQTLAKTFPNVLIEVNGYDVEVFRVELHIWNSMRRSMAFFTILATLIASMGLFGLVFFVSQRRVKEIGIRKVQGAKAVQIFPVLTRQFIILVLIANVNVFPLAYLLEHYMPGQFKYHFTLQDIIMVLAITVAITLFSSGFQALKASFVNPIKALRYE